MLYQQDNKYVNFCIFPFVSDWDPMISITNDEACGKSFTLAKQLLDN